MFLERERGGQRECLPYPLSLNDENIAPRVEGVVDVALMDVLLPPNVGPLFRPGEDLAKDSVDELRASISLGEGRIRVGANFGEQAIKGVGVIFVGSHVGSRTTTP